MDGVRRWITSGSPSTRKSAHIEHGHAPTSKASKHEIKVDKNSTEYIAVALLDPVVPEGEELEYNAYVEQCDELSRAPPELAGRKDQKVYEGAVILSSLGDESSELIKEKDNELYRVYVEKGRPYTADVVDGKETLPVVSDYEKWVITGVS